jgi:hypothetical protein
VFSSFQMGRIIQGEWEEDGGMKVICLGSHLICFYFLLQYRHGKGTLTLGPESYQGQWLNDVMCGPGKYCFASGLLMLNIKWQTKTDVFCRCNLYRKFQRKYVRW